VTRALLLVAQAAAAQPAPLPELSANSARRRGRMNMSENGVSTPAHPPMLV
jgi:hypothetical protein